jgi:hypothetical protein
VLAAAAKEIGEANLKCITFSGTGYDGAVAKDCPSPGRRRFGRVGPL